MERRRESRFIEDLPVRVWAVDERGCWYAQFAVAHNISSRGALLKGLEREFRCGDLIGVEYSEVRARFRVIWVRDSQGPFRVQAAVQRLEEDKCPWGQVLVEREALKST